MNPMFQSNLVGQKLFYRSDEDSDRWHHATIVATLVKECPSQPLTSLLDMKLFLYVSVQSGADQGKLFCLPYNSDLISFSPPLSAAAGVRVTYCGDNVIPLIKIIRAYTMLGLKEAKDLVDGLRSYGRIIEIKEVVNHEGGRRPMSQADAANLFDELREIGAGAELIV